MATTQRGIIYPDDYSAVADIPEDLETMAESIDTAIGDSESTIQEDITAIQTEQTTQNSEITALQTENSRLKATLPTTTGTGETPTLDKTAEMEFVKPPLPRGNSTQVQLTGKNKFTTTDNFVLVTGSTSYEITGENSIKVSSTDNTYSYRYAKFKLEGLTVGQTYYIKANYTNTNSNYNKGPLYIRNENDSASLNANDNYESGSSMSFVPTESKVIIRFYASAGTALINTCSWFDIMISTTNNDTYEPYCGGIASPNPSYPQPISNVTGDVEVLVQNKNITPSNMYNTQINQTGAINFSSNRVSNVALDTTSNLYLKAGVYTLSIENLDYCSVLTKNKNGEIIDNFATSWHELPYTFTLTQDGFIYFTGRKDGNPNINANDYVPQLELNTTATSYTPHKEQTFTFPLGSQRMFLGDYLADDGIHHVRKRIVLTGSEEWYINSSVFNIRSLAYKSTELDAVSIICDTYKGVGNVNSSSSAYNRGNNTICNYNDSATSRLFIRDDRFTTVADFKTWLSTNNVTVEYELATEEITPYTTEQQQAYDEIKQAISYEEQTNISGTSDEANPIFSVEAYQSIKLVLAD